MLATVPFQIGTSTTSSSPFAPDIVTFTVTSQLLNQVRVHHQFQGSHYLLGGGGDGVYGAHEDVRHDEDGHEAVEEAGQVEGDPQPEWPGHLQSDFSTHGRDHIRQSVPLSLLESFKAFLCHKEPAQGM